MISKLFFSFMEFVLRPYPQHTSKRWACHYLSGRGTKMYLPKEFLVAQLQIKPSHTTQWAVSHGQYSGNQDNTMKTGWETTVGKFLYKDTETMRHYLDHYIFYENCEGVQIFNTSTLDGACSSNHCRCDRMDINWPTSALQAKRKKINMPHFLRNYLKHLDSKITIPLGPLHIKIRIWGIGWSKPNITISIKSARQDEWMSKHGRPFWSVGHIAHTERENT